MYFFSNVNLMNSGLPFDMSIVVLIVDCHQVVYVYLGVV